VNSLDGWLVGWLVGWMDGWMGMCGWDGRMGRWIDGWVHSKKMLGCFNPILGKIWTNPIVGLKMEFINLSQVLGIWDCQYLTQNWVKTTQML